MKTIADIARRDSDRLTSDIKSAIRDIDNLSEVLDAAIKSGMILPPYSTQIHETVKRLKRR